MTTQRERPIIFSGPMVRAILADRKSQTRRVVKPQPIDFYVASYEPMTLIDAVPGELMARRIMFPYGIPGDRLWVRETWTHTGEGVWSPRDAAAAGGGRVLYRATDEAPCKGCWFPSIHMPRWASRITLEIVAVRVERVQEISGDDAFAEGVVDDIRLSIEAWNARAVAHFRNLWNDLNAKRGFGWDANPWVWVVEFKRIASAS